ncbi:MAG: LamG domain-containing protein [Verrucomicrobiae bacterium]|nr:LamG domain-containing protein [Verrucomicrobiae bacterium]MDW8343737.1 LamG-like jellyroll fold domain-containing protein [Verrucomicrobiae bacterium]
MNTSSTVSLQDILATLPARERPATIPGLIAFWDFQGFGTQHEARGVCPFTLVEQRGPIARASEGVFGPQSLRIAHGQWLRLPRAELGALNIHGHRPLSLIAWVKPDSDRLWQFVAGVWNERDHQRQYALFFNGAWQYDHVAGMRTPCTRRAHAYLSREGGHTPGHPACFSYATGQTELRPGAWYCLALTYDGEQLAVHVNGRLDANPRHNPLPFPGPIFDGGATGADFTVAQRAMAMWREYPHGVIPVAEGFSGLLGGLAVYDRALSEEELVSLTGELSQ